MSEPTSNTEKQEEVSQDNETVLNLDAEAALQEAASQEGNPTAQLEQQIADLKDQLLRTAAEAENTRKRFQREQEETAKYAVTSFARDLVEVGENLYRALESIPAQAKETDENLRNLSDGVDMTLRNLLSVFEKHGIRRVEPMGEKFDHNLHQAVMQVEDATVAPGTVTQVLQAGYVIRDRLLRPAMVGVAKAPAQAAE